MRPAAVALVVALGAAIVTGAVAREVHASRDTRVVAGVARTPPPSFRKDAPSNILPGDYVGPDACSTCHEENYEAWLKHPHRRMNQLASDASVIGDFGGASVSTAGVTAHFDHAPGGDYTMTIDLADGATRAYRITRTIGVRFRQFYVGVLTKGEPLAYNTRDDEVVLPFGWWISEKRWMPHKYFDPYGEEETESAEATTDPIGIVDRKMRTNCAYCHNTVPYLFRLGHDYTPLRGFAQTDLALDEPGLRGELAGWVSLDGLGGFPPGIQARFDVASHFVTVGISCESCHFGARQHAEHKTKYRFGPSSPYVDLHPATPGRSDARTKDNPWIVNGICAQCHTSDGPYYADGSSKENSREARELEHGACVSRIACTNCHNPHEAGPAVEGGPDDPSQVGACTHCHARYASTQAAEAHGRHTLAQASCLDCHMPRITHGITRTVRSHRISVPVDPRMLATGAPNACNVCHVDRSPAWTIAELAKGWGRVVKPEPGWAAAWAGSLDTPAMDAWGAAKDQHERLVLVDALGRRHDDESLGRLAAMLDDPAPSTRTFAEVAIERRIGRQLSSGELDVLGPSSTRRAQIAVLLPKLREPSRLTRR